MELKFLKVYIPAMTKDQVKEILDRVLSWVEDAIR